MSALHAHIPDEVLSAYVDGEASAVEREQVGAGVESCQECAARLSDLIALAGLVRSLPLEDAPPFPGIEPRVERATSLVRRLAQPRLVGGLAFAAAVLIGFLVSPLFLPGGSSGPTISSAPGAPLAQGAMFAVPPDLAVKASAALPPGGTAVLSAANSRLSPNQPIRLLLVLRGSPYAVSAFRLRAQPERAPGTTALEIASSSSAGPPGHLGPAATRADSLPAPSVAPGPVQDLLVADQSWPPASARLEPGIYNILAEVTLVNGARAEVTLTVTVGP